MTNNRYKLDEQGNPVPCPSLMEWGRFMERVEPRRIGHDHLENGVRVSTIFLGLDHNFEGTGPPILWETMIFGGRHDQFQERYSSREDAVAGHARAIALAKTTKGPIIR